MGLNPTENEGTTPGENSYFCGFDTICMAGNESSRSVENVLLVGYQGGLEVFKVEKGRMDIVARLEGLRGSVIGAKILPWASRRDLLASSRPLIALTIHGPVMDEVKDAQNASGSSSEVVTEENDGSSPSRPGSSKGNDAASRISNYQTTVEVYSLRERRHIATLYKKIGRASCRERVFALV